MSSVTNETNVSISFSVKGATGCVKVEIEVAAVEEEVIAGSNKDI